MDKCLNQIIAAINEILIAGINYDFDFDKFTCNLNNGEFFKRIVIETHYDEYIKKLITENKCDEFLFYYELTRLMNSEIISEENKILIDSYNEIVSNNAKYVYLMFASESLRESKSFWINIAKQIKDLEELKSLLIFIPDDIKKSSDFKMTFSSVLVQAGEDVLNIASMCGELFNIPSFAIDFIKSVYYDLELKDEVYMSFSKEMSLNSVYESKYGKFIRKNIDYWMSLTDFRNKIFEISTDFIKFIPDEYIDDDFINKVRFYICNREFVNDTDFSILEFLDKKSKKNITDVKVYKKNNLI